MSGIRFSGYTKKISVNVLLILGMFVILSYGVYAVDATACGTLNQPNTVYRLMNDINNHAGTCFTITADNIKLDGRGYKISGARNYNGVYASARNNITITDINVNSFGFGIRFDNTDNSHIENVNTSKNLQGIFLTDGSSNNVISNINSSSNYRNGVSFWSNSNNNILNIAETSYNEEGVSLYGSSNITISDINADGNIYYGINLESGSNKNVISNINSSRNLHGISVSGSSDNVISNITLLDNSYYGLILASSASNNFTSLISTGNSNKDLYQSGTAADNTYFIDSIIMTYKINTPSKFIFINTIFGEIGFLNGISGAGSDLIGSSTSDIRIGDNSIYVNSAQTGLNKSANVTLYGLSTSITNPAIFRDGVDCPSNICVAQTSLKAETVVFNVTGWSNYSIGQTTNLTECGTLDKANTVYNLQNNIFNYGRTYCFEITANNVTLNGNGYEIDGDGDTQYGVYTAMNNVTIKNLRIKMFLYSGIWFEGGEDNKIINVTSNDNANNHGIYLDGSSRTTIANSTVNSNADSGIYFGSSSDNIITNVIANSNAYGISLFGINNNFTNISLTANTNKDFYVFTTAADNTYFTNSIIKSYQIDVASKLIFRNTTWGEARFLNGISGSGNDLWSNSSSDLRFGNNSVYINSAQTGLNKSANVTLYGLPTTFANPKIMRDGALCAAGVCYNFTSLNAGNVVFNVSYWSNYSIGENPTSASNCTGGCFFVRNSSNVNVSIFDKFGNMDLRGSVTQSSVGTPNGRDFVIKNLTSGNVVAWIDDATGNLRLAGTLTQNTGTVCTPPTRSFVIKNSSGSCMSYIDLNGNAVFKGRVAQSVVI